MIENKWAEPRRDGRTSFFCKNSAVVSEGKAGSGGGMGRRRACGGGEWAFAPDFTAFVVLPCAFYGAADRQTRRGGCSPTP